MIWLYLLAVSCVYSLGCWLTYLDGHRRAWWYVPLGVVLGAVINTIWFLAVRHLDDRQRIFVFSLAWDAVFVLIYYLMPLVFFGVRPDRTGIIGAILVLSGLAVLKLKF